MVNLDESWWKNVEQMFLRLETVIASNEEKKRGLIKYFWH